LKKYLFLLFFGDCNTVLEKPEFYELNNFLNSDFSNDGYSKVNEILPPDKCFRLNNNYYLFTVTDTGRTGQGLYFYDAKTNKSGLDDDQYMPGITVEKEFLGPRNKRFVLLTGSNLIHGNWDVWFNILNLTPMKNGKPYLHYPLMFANESPLDGMCGGESSSTWDNDVPAPLYISKGIATSIRSYKIFNEGTNAVNIVFNVKEEDCKTLKQKSYKKIFLLKNGRFVEKQ
jgi:hypothetical protein